MVTGSITTRLQKLEAQSPQRARPVFQITVQTQEDADAVERCSAENPDAIVIRRIIVWPPERDAEGNITAPARDYRGPIRNAA